MLYTKDELISLCNEETPMFNAPALYQLASDADDETRLFVAELLAYDQSEQSMTVLLSLLQDDTDELVRAEAADSLSCFEREELLTPLMVAFSKETSDLVKGYILLAVRDLADCFNSQCIYSTMEQIFASEQAFSVRSVCAGYLYRHGQQEMLAFLQEGLDSSDFYVRQWAAKQLPEP